MTSTETSTIRPDPTGGPTDDELLAAYGTALDQLVAVVADVRPDQAHASTPCTAWDVEHLVGHVLFGLGRSARIAVGGDAFAQPAVEVPEPETSWAEQVGAAADEARRAWADADLDAPVTVPWGTVPARGALAGYTREAAVHTWDLQVALGRPGGAGLDPAVAELADALTRGLIPDAARGEGPPFPFGAEQAAPTGADPYTRLAAHAGRRP